MTQLGQPRDIPSPDVDIDTYLGRDPFISFVTYEVKITVSSQCQGRDLSGLAVDFGEDCCEDCKQINICKFSVASQLANYKYLGPNGTVKLSLYDLCPGCNSDNNDSFTIGFVCTASSTTNSGELVWPLGQSLQ